MATTISSPGAAAPPSTAWRTRDIVVTAIIGVTFGVVFWVWGLAWGGLDAVFVFAPPAKDLLYAVWLVPAVLAPYIVRKPGAAVFAEMVAAGVSALLGSQWGPDALLSGFIQGAAAELVFAFTLYRVWTFPILAAAARGIGGGGVAPRLGAVLHGGLARAAARPGPVDGGVRDRDRGGRHGRAGQGAAPGRRPGGVPS